MAIYNPLTGYEPNQLDNFDYSDAFAAVAREACRCLSRDGAGEVDMGPQGAGGQQKNSRFCKAEIVPTCQSPATLSHSGSVGHSPPAMGGRPAVYTCAGARLPKRPD